MHLGTANPSSTYSMSTSDGTQHELESVTTEKDLGVTVDNKLQFSDHVRQIVNKANRVLGCLKHLQVYDL